jgi:DNA-binding transcriptional MerR regulator
VSPTHSINGFTTPETVSLTGATYHQLRYWDRIGLVRPSVQKTGGRPGVPRFWSSEDINKIRAIVYRLDAGWSLQKVRKEIA